MVVVFYRKGWGQTSWTRIEETAIKNRALMEGYEFTLFIPRDEPPQVPNYLPHTYIWYGINRFGEKVALSIIESKIQSCGGEITKDTPEIIAKRIKEKENFNNYRNGILNSPKGVDRAHEELKKLYELLQQKKKTIEHELNGFSIGYEEKDNICFIHSHGYSLRFYWYSQFWNSLSESYFHISLHSPNRHPDPPTILIDFRLNFDLAYPDINGWSFEDDRKNFQTSEDLVDYTLGILLNHIEKENERKRLNRYL